MTAASTAYHDALARRVVQIATDAALAYLQTHDLGHDSAALVVALKDEVKAAYPRAVADAKEALACGMREVADRTFAATFALAGIEAAKKVGRKS